MYMATQTSLSLNQSNLVLHWQTDEDYIEVWSGNKWNQTYRLYRKSEWKINSICKYSQLSRKWPPLVHDKVIAYGRWSSMGKIKKKTQTKLINVIT